MIWNENTITIVPPKKPKKITGTRLAAVMDLNKWSTPFEAWCAITRTYEKPFEDTIYTKAGKVIEPKQAEYIANKYFWRKIITPTDVYGENYFKKTWGDFFPDNKIFGGMWDYLGYDLNGKECKCVFEMKTTKRAEDWVDDIPEYYAIQATLYAYLLGVDDVVMVCSILEDKDYVNPEEYVCTPDNTFERTFKVSERYPKFKRTLKKVETWWENHVENGESPIFDEKKDADILKELRKNNIPPEADLDALLNEAETLQEKINSVYDSIEKEEERLKTLKDSIKKILMDKFRDGDTKVTCSGSRYIWTTSVSTSLKIDEEAMKNDGILEKYKTKKSTVYKLTNTRKD